MSKTFKVAEAVSIEALGPDEAEHPLLYVRFDDYPDEQVVVVFADEIVALVNALTEAAVWLANQIK